MLNYSITEVAKQLNMSRQGVHWHIVKGNLKAKKVGKLYIISERDLDKFIASRKEV